MKIFELANILEINVGCNLKWKSYLLALEKKMSSGLFSFLRESVDLNCYDSQFIMLCFLLLSKYGVEVYRDRPTNENL